MRVFPELAPSEDMSPSENTFLPSSESVGCGHNDCPERQAPFSNEEFPNTESGEGLTD